MNLIDRAIEVFSPQKAFRREMFRKALKHRGESGRYAAAKTHRLIGDWSPVNQGVNAMIGAAAPTVRARVRQLVRDFPYFARAVNILADYVVGDGIMFQSRIETPDGKINKKASQEVEDVFKFWADEADIAGRLHYYEMMHLAKVQDIECGEFLIIRRYPNDKRYLPYALQMVESDWLTDMNTQGAGAGNKLEWGIESDPTTGAVIAYHFTDPNSWGKGMRIPAADVIHGFKTVRPGQKRGMSIFAPAVLVAHDLSDYMDSEMDATKMASKHLLFVKSADPYLRQMGTVTTDDDGKKIEEMENAIIEYLREGEDVTIATNPRPGNNFEPFVKFILRMVAITGGLPYELISGDYGDLNFSTVKAVRNDFAQILRPLAGRHVRHYAMKTFVPFMETAVMSGKLNSPGYLKNPWPYLACEWQPPGMESVDPLTDTKAYIDQMQKGLRSPQEIAKSRGRDLETIYREIVAAKEMAEEMGLKFEEVSTAMAGNPAAVEEQKIESVMTELKSEPAVLPSSAPAREIELTDKFIDALNDISARNASAIEKIAAGAPKTIQVNTPPMDINLKIEQSGPGAATKTIRIKDRDGNIVRTGELKEE